MKIVKDNLIALGVLPKNAQGEEEIEKAVKRFQEDYSICNPKNKLHNYNSFKLEVTKNKGTIERHTLLAMDEALKNQWKYNGLLHESWSNNETLNKIAKGTAKAPEKNCYKSGDKDENVRLIQNNLKAFGLLSDVNPTTTFFGDKTRQAVKIFQLSYELPEGKEPIHDAIKKPLKKHIEFGAVDCQTLLAMDEALVNGWSAKLKLSFPMDFIPPKSYKERPRSFGAWRLGDRLHAGCDLYAPMDTPVYAIADGTIVAYQEFGAIKAKNKGSVVYQIVVDHGYFIANYRELSPASDVDIAVAGVDLTDCETMKKNRKGKGMADGLKIGSKVKAGQHIGYVGLLLYINTNEGKIYDEASMLHLEIYRDTNKPHEVMNAYLNISKYGRRSDLLDPTDFLDLARLSLPQKDK
jgi:murein DD-endopeptidase MepM/ murein hydrolase activator NlpD